MGVRPNRRGKIILLLIAGAIGVLGLLTWRPVLEVIVYDRVLVDEQTADRLIQENFGYAEATGQRIRGWWRTNLWTGRAERLICFYVDTGFMAVDEQAPLITIFSSDGRVVSQQNTQTGENRVSPPWVGGLTDQAAPTAPDWLVDDEQWQAAVANW